MKLYQKEMIQLITLANTNIDLFVDKIIELSKEHKDSNITQIAYKLQYNLSKSKTIKGEDKKKVINFFFFFLKKLASELGLFLSYNNKSISQWQEDTGLYENVFRIDGYSTDAIEKIYYATGKNPSELKINETDILEKSDNYYYFMVKNIKDDSYTWIGVPDFQFYGFNHFNHIRSYGLDKDKVTEVAINGYPTPKPQAHFGNGIFEEETN